jgi:hypothetical protein
MEKFKKVLKVGQIEKIYYDPITREKFEGFAKLVAIICELGDGLETWYVRFLNEPDNEYMRTIDTTLNPIRCGES